jgi:ComF family protein
MKILTHLTNMIFPRTCVLCGDSGANNIDLCLSCQKELPIITNACSQCGMELDNFQEASPTKPCKTNICGACLKDPPPFDRTIAIFNYHSPIDQFIINLKFHKNLLYAAILGKLTAKSLELCYEHCNKPEVIIPIPLHPNRLKERGFNQSLELFHPIAKKLHIPIDAYNWLRTKDTVAQSLLDGNERRKNIQHAFSCNRKYKTNPYPYSYVAVVDDVFTTGATLREFCKTLRTAGIKKIDVWTCAHAVC